MYLFFFLSCSLWNWSFFWRKLSYNFVKISLPFFFLFVSSAYIFASEISLKTLESRLIFGCVLLCHLINLAISRWGGNFFSNITLSLSFFCFVLLSLSLGWEGTFFMDTTLSSFLFSPFNLSLEWQETFHTNMMLSSFFCFVLLLSLSLGWGGTFLTNTTLSSFFCFVLLLSLSLGWEGTYFTNATSSSSSLSFFLFLVYLMDEKEPFSWTQRQRFFLLGWPISRVRRNF